MTPKRTKLTAKMREVVKAAYDAQEITSLTAEEFDALDSIMGAAMELVGADDLTVSQFISQ